MTTTPWDTLIAIALVGTDRRAFALPADSSGVGTLLAKAQTADAEHGLLAALGAYSLYRRAGQYPAKGAMPVPPLCPAETWPVCSPGAAQHLNAMLLGTHPRALAEWLTAAATLGRIVPPALVPSLLQVGLDRPDLHGLIRTVIGRRGDWLAERQKRWGYGRNWTQRTQAELADLWESGSREERLSVLAVWRGKDPAAGRACVEAVWADENADVRAQLMATLRLGLSAADEPFLERGLDDRSVEVRRMAADVIAALPEAAWRHRMEARARAAVRIAVARRGLLGRRGLTLTVTPPPACDPAMQRDGIVEQPPHARGTGAWWLLQIVGRVRPSLFLPGPEWTPDALLEQAEASEWRAALVEGWALGAARYGDASWAQALIPAILRANDPLPLRPLLQVLSPEQRDAVDERLERETPPAAAGSSWLRLLGDDDRPWSLARTRRVVRRVAEVAARQRLADATNPLAHSLVHGAPLAHPDIWDEAARVLEPARAQYATPRNPVEQFLSMVEFRVHMLKELAR